MSEDLLLHAKSIVDTEPDEALAICNDILNTEFDSDLGQMALFMSAYIMMQAERYGLAYQIYQRCAQLKPNLSDIWSNMGMCLEENDPEKAKRLFQKAIRLSKGNSKALANKGLMHLNTGEPQKCVELSERALAINPNEVNAIHNRGLAKLMLRDWSGWDDYHHTLGVTHREARDYGKPEWRGEPGTVLVYGEQGVGDEIMFASCLPDLLATNNVVFDSDERLESLFGRSFDCDVYGDRFKTESRAADQKYDYQCAIGQLPYFFRRKDEDFPGTPYLKPNPDRSFQWRALFDTFPGKKIGVAWRGGLRNTGEARRSLDISDLKTILNNEDTFISLEYKNVDQVVLEEYNLKSYPIVTKQGGSIDELAAIIGELDMVVTCCTTVVYIAGALGIPCHVLTPKHPGYRYHINGDSFPWYNSVSIHRQTGSWRELSEKVAGIINAANTDRVRSC